MPSRSRPSAKPSTTSRRTSKARSGARALARLIEDLPTERIEQVFAHPSGAPDRLSSYERLEFLGDSVLELAVARALFEEYPEFEEGRLAKIRSHVVSRQSCAEVARDLGLDRLLVERGVGVPSEELERLARNTNVLAALLEAALAALFLEHGFEPLDGPIVEAFRGRIEYALTTHVDYKTELQEVLARDGRQVVYSVIGTDGPPHERTFTAAATIDGRRAGLGKGRSKKDAEQAAAKEALAEMGG
jgi:ribonuclease-3